MTAADYCTENYGVSLAEISRHFSTDEKPMTRRTLETWWDTRREAFECIVHGAATKISEKKRSNRLRSAK